MQSILKMTGGLCAARFSVLCSANAISFTLPFSAKSQDNAQFTSDHKKRKADKKPDKKSAAP